MQPGAPEDPGRPGGAGGPDRVWAVAAVVVLLCALVYFGSLRGEFLNWDDAEYVTENPELRLPLGKAVASVFGTFLTANWNPLQRLSYVLEWHAFGPSAFAFRLDNLLLHAATCVVVFLLLREWLRNGTAALLGAAAFAVHPANVENVAWVAERKTLLASLLGFWAALVWTRAEGRTRARLAALALFAVGLLAKTSIVVLPALLFLLDRSAKRRPAWTWYAAFALVAVPAAWMQVRAASAQGTIQGLHGGTVATHLATCVAALPAYAEAVVAPFALVPRHPWDDVASAADPRVLLGLGLLAVLAWGVARSWRANGRLAVSAPWVLATLAPTLLVPIPIVVADRYLYLALPFLLGGAAAWVVERTSGASPVVKWAPAAAVVVLAATASAYAQDWRTSTTLWTRQLVHHPTDTAAWHSLAVARLADGDRVAARACYVQLLDLDPAYPAARAELAYIDIGDGRAADAERSMENLVADDPDDGLAWSTLALARESQGRVDDARRTLTDAVARHPEDAHLIANLAAFRARHPEPGGR